MQKLGRIFIVAAASGTGKTSLVHALLQEDKHLSLAISHTSREKRSGEEHGKHYYFVNKDEFESLIGQGAFLEHAIVHGNYYGTSTAAINQLQRQGLDVILEIDVQGARQVRLQLPDAISIFILPPSMKELEQRLRSRNTDSDEVIKTRLDNARSEIEEAACFDYLVVNDDFATAKQDLLNIIRASRLLQSNNNIDFLQILS